MKTLFEVKSEDNYGTEGENLLKSKVRFRVR